MRAPLDAMRVRREGTPWAAVWTVARAERRAGRLTVTLLAALFGVVAGLVAGAGVVADRTASAYDRLVDAVGLDDARVLVAADQPGLAESVPRMPAVREAWVTSGWVARVEGPAVRYLSLGAGEEAPPDLLHPVVVAGRMPAPAAVDEMVVGEPLAEPGDLTIGTAVTLRMLSLRQISQFGTAFGEPAGPTVRMRVVGVVRLPAWGGAVPNAFAGPAFARAYGAGAPTRPVYVRLDGSPDATQRFGAAYRAAAAAVPSVASAFLPPVAFPREDVDPSLSGTARAVDVGLGVFGVVLAAAGLLLVGQASGRHHAARGGAQRVEEALGLTRTERVGARALAAAGPAALAAVMAGLLATAAGGLPPLGSLARFEPDPSFRPVGPVVVAGIAGAAAGFLLLVAAAAVTAGRSRPGAVRPSRRPGSGLNLLPGRPALLAGVGLALRGRAGGPPALAAPAAAVVVAAVVTATLAFGASAARAVDEPERHGQAADLTVVDAREPDVALIAVDPRVAAVTVVRSATLRLADGTVLPVQARVPRAGALPLGVGAGRPPATADEIALSPRTAARIGVGVGDVVTVVRDDGTPVPLTVCGTVVAADDAGHLGETAVVDPALLPQVARSLPLVSAEVLARPGAAGALRRDLGARLEIAPRTLPPEVRGLADLRRLPEILAVVVSVLAGAALANTFSGAARRHDSVLAVLAALGATPAQIRATLGVFAGVVLLPAAVIGVPLGLGIARVLWWQVATSVGVAAGLAPPVGLLTVALPSLALGALLSAPALRRAMGR